MTKEFDLFLKDFGLSTFADDILGSTVLKEPTSLTHQHGNNKHNKQNTKSMKNHIMNHPSTHLSNYQLNNRNNNNKMIIDHVEEDDDDSDDDDIPLSKCVFSQQPQPFYSSLNLKSPTETIYSSIPQLSTNDQDEDDEDLVPIAVLQDPKVKSQLTFQSAAEKYKKSILDRDPQLKTRHHLNDRRHSLDPNNRHHSSSTTTTSRYHHHSSSTVMRSVSAGQKHRYHHPSKQIHSSHYNQVVDDGDDSDDDVPLFQTCLVSTSMNVKPSNFVMK
ncbi:unnamed protein product [Cunninghamella blakesleeana]